jgi:Raf kinase inhibitor-like YbhB/YbcL family protein
MIANTMLCAVTLATTLGLTAEAAGASLKLTSPDIKPGATIAAEQTFNDFGCSGANISPALEWSGAPAGTKGFAVLMHDPDAPTGGAGWWHWVMFNIPATTTKLPKGAGKADGSALPSGAASGVTDFGTPGYGGPCPPQGDKPHRYIFTVYALKVDKLDVPKGATASLVGFMVNANAIGKATLTGMYGRKK